MADTSRQVCMSGAPRWVCMFVSNLENLYVSQVSNSFEKAFKIWRLIQFFVELWGGVLLDAQLGCKSVCMYVWTPAHYVYVCMFGPSSTSACMQWLSIYVCMFETLIRVCMYVRRNPRACICMYGWEYLQIRCIVYVCFKWRIIYVCMSQTYIQTEN